MRDEEAKSETEFPKVESYRLRIDETEVRSLVYDIPKQCFGEDHIATMLAEKTPWSLLKGIPLNELTVPKQPMELIKDLEKPNQPYIV